MSRFLLDSGIASDYLNHRHRVFERGRHEVAAGNRIGIVVPVLAELVAGIEHSQARDRNMQRLQNALGTLKIWPLDVRAAFAYGHIWAQLAKVGRPMQSIDIMLAAIAMTLRNCIVVSADSDLSAIPGLDVQNWRS